MFNRNMDSVLGAKSSNTNDTYVDQSKVAKLRAKRTSLIKQYEAQDAQTKDNPVQVKVVPKKEIKHTTTTNIKHQSKPSWFTTSTPRITDALVIAFFISLIVLFVMS